VCTFVVVIVFVIRHRPFRASALRADGLPQRRMRGNYHKLLHATTWVRVTQAPQGFRTSSAPCTVRAAPGRSGYSSAVRLYQGASCATIKQRKGQVFYIQFSKGEARKRLGRRRSIKGA
jgi:hypothetical protein